MPWPETFLNHTCDIYHIIEEERSPGYGLPGAPAFHYPEEPDLSEVPCHFGVRTATISTEQSEPMENLESRIKLALPTGTDIRINDKIVRCDNGLEYQAELPVHVHGEHHYFVYVKRVTRHKEL